MRHFRCFSALPHTGGPVPGPDIRVLRCVLSVCVCDYQSWRWFLLVRLEVGPNISDARGPSSQAPLLRHGRHRGCLGRYITSGVMPQTTVLS